MTRNIRRRLLGTTFITMLSVSSAALAQQAATPGYGPGRGMMGGNGRGAGVGMMGRPWNTATYLDSLKTELGITKDQETAWKSYADVVTGVRQTMQGLHQSMFETMGSASWQHRRDSMNAMLQARQDAYDRVHEAAGKLIPTLNPEQQTKAQSILPGLGFGPGMMRGPGMMGGPPSDSR